MQPFSCYMYLCVTVVIPLLTIAVILALCLLVVVVACAVRYARKYCCCLAPRVGSYTPSPSPSPQPRGHVAINPASTNARPARRVHRRRDARMSARVAPVAKTDLAYRSVVVIGSDRIARRAVPTKDRAMPYWTVRRNTGSSTWGNLAQVPAPPAALASQTVVLSGRSSATQSRDDVDEAGRTVPAMMSLLDGRLNVSAQIHDSQTKLHDN